jgi:hypothetical protein
LLPSVGSPSKVLHAIRRVLGAESIALHDDVVRLYPSGGDIDGSSRAAMQAQTMFIRLGQRRGLIAMQRIRKGGLSSLLA